jgi:hypothetical protein
MKCYCNREEAGIHVVVPRIYSFRYGIKAALSLESTLVDVILLEYRKLASQHPYDLSLCVFNYYTMKA